MKRCKANLHNYEGKQCGECKKIWWDLVKHAQRENKSAYDKCRREHQNELRRKRKAANPEKYFNLQKAVNARRQAKRNMYQTNRKAAKLMRTPEWLTDLDWQHIEIFYDSAKRLTEELSIQFEVDHIVPLQGKNVCGLHVPWNLQVIPAKDNMSKGNRCE